jgi:hypothetical protein
MLSQRRLVNLEDSYESVNRSSLTVTMKLHPPAGGIYTLYSLSGTWNHLFLGSWGDDWQEKSRQLPQKGDFMWEPVSQDTRWITRPSLRLAGQKSRSSNHLLCPQGHPDTLFPYDLRVHSCHTRTQAVGRSCGNRRRALTSFPGSCDKIPDPCVPQHRDLVSHDHGKGRVRVSDSESCFQECGLLLHP